MNILRKLAVAFIGLLAATAMINAEAVAQDVAVDQAIVIDFSEDGNAVVKHTVEIKNVSQSKLANDVNIKLPGSVNQVSASLSTGAAVPMTYTDSEIKIQNLYQVVKLGESATLTINYQTNSFVSRQGSVFSLFIPKFSQSDYSLQINTPQSWGNPLYSSGQPVGTNTLYYAEYGSFNSVLFDATWGLGEKGNYLIPYPHSRYAVLQSNEIYSNVLAVNTAAGGVFIKAGEYNKQGSIKGELQFYTSKYGAQQSNQTPRDLSGLNIDVNLGDEEGYRQILQKYSPASSYALQNVLSFEELAQQTELSPQDYAYVVQQFMLAKGYKANLMYGMVKFPQSNWQWHVWLEYQKSEGSWQQLDPFLHDMQELEMWNNVTQLRVPWGIIEYNKIADVAFGSVDIGAEVVFIDVEHLQPSTNLLIRADIAPEINAGTNTDIGVILENEANQVIELTEIVISGKRYQQQQMLLPGETRRIVVPHSAGRNPLQTGASEIEIIAKYTNGADQLESSVKQEVRLKINVSILLVNTIILFVLSTFAILYLKHLFARRSANH